jgi:hypothetical protein
VACGGAYHHIIRKGGSIYDLIFDYSHNYQTVYSLTLADWTYNTYDYGVWVEEDENMLHFVAVNNTGGDSGSGLVNIQAWECSGYGLNYVFSEVFSQNEINSTADYSANRYMRLPYLTKDLEDRYNLFYMWYDNGSYSIDVAVEEDVCVRGAWTPTEECFGSYRKFNRTVFPEGCDTNTTYWAMDEYCIEGVPCSVGWICVDGDTRAYQQLDCTLINETDCTGGTPYCFGGECVAECEKGYFCYDDETRCYRDLDCTLSECLDCNSTGYGYCYDARCYEILTPAFDEDASVLDILEEMTSGIKSLLAWISLPVFKILLAIAIMLLILGIFGLILTVARKSTPRR